MRAASQQWHVNSMTYLGIYYYFGYDIEQSRQDAWRLFQEAATLGDLSAKYYLGLCYLKGEGVSEDQTRGFEILVDCASEGTPWAQLAAADCYKNGIGTEIDLFEAVSWYARAADQGV